MWRCIVSVSYTHLDVYKRQLMNMVITSGGIEILTKVIAAFTNSVTASGASCMTAGVMSWFSSTLGVVVPTLTPTVEELVEEIGGGLTQIGLLSAMLIGSSSACFSPASSVGGLIISSIAGDPILRDGFDNEKACLLYTSQLPMNPPATRVCFIL